MLAWSTVSRQVLFIFSLQFTFSCNSLVHDPAHNYIIKVKINFWNKPNLGYKLDMYFGPIYVNSFPSLSVRMACILKIHVHFILYQHWHISILYFLFPCLFFERKKIREIEFYWISRKKYGKLINFVFSFPCLFLKFIHSLFEIFIAILQILLCYSIF